MVSDAGIHTCGAQFLSHDIAQELAKFLPVGRGQPHGLPSLLDGKRCMSFILFYCSVRYKLEADSSITVDGFAKLTRCFSIKFAPQNGHHLTTVPWFICRAPGGIRYTAATRVLPVVMLVGTKA